MFVGFWDTLSNSALRRKSRTHQWTCQKWLRPFSSTEELANSYIRMGWTNQERRRNSNLILGLRNLWKSPSGRETFPSILSLRPISFFEFVLVSHLRLEKLPSCVDDTECLIAHYVVVNSRGFCCLNKCWLASTDCANIATLFQHSLNKYLRDGRSPL